MTIHDPISAVLTSVTQAGGRAAGRLRVQSALNPILWMIGIVDPFAIAGGYLFRDFPVVLTVFVVLGALPILTGCGLAIYFATHDSAKLQSEGFQLRHESMQLIRHQVVNQPTDPELIRTLAGATHQLLPGNEETSQ